MTDEPVGDGGDGVTPSDGAVADPDLTYPDRDWGGFFKNHFGPSMLWALISIGGSHIVLAPTLGATFGLFAVWMFLLIYVAKYGGWELGIRYNYGVGGNPIEAYRDLPGPKNWALWLTLFIFTVMYAGITAAVGMSTAALSTALLPFGPTIGPFQTIVVVYATLIAVATGLVLFSRYSLLEKILAGFTVALGILIVLGAIAGPPTGTIQTAFDVPDLTGPMFVVLFAAAAGFAPTGHSTSILIGSWSMAKGEGASELREKGLNPEDEAYHDYVRAWIETGRRDFNIGYAFSFVIALSMILLAVNVLYPEPLGDEGFEIALASLLGESFGEWSFYAMVIGAFAALYSTVITLLDGASRAASDILPLATENEDLDRERVRRIVVVWLALATVVPIAYIGALPVSLIVWIAALMAVVEVFFYPANWYVVEKHLPEPFRPSTTWKVYYVITIGIVVLFGAMGAAAELGIFEA